jgi:hypothetical protein
VKEHDRVPGPGVVMRKHAHTVTSRS